MAGLGIALRGIGKAVKKGISKISNMSDKTAGTVTMTGVGASVVGGGELLKHKKKKNSKPKAKSKKTKLGPMGPRPTGRPELTGGPKAKPTPKFKFEIPTRDKFKKMSNGKK
tara:strand:- start:36 stop:371 length:336 start_codon:yes stop_codon:yes gene_type:complete